MTSSAIAYPNTKNIYLCLDVNTQAPKRFDLSGIIYTKLGKELFERIPKTHNNIFFEEVKKYIEKRHGIRLVLYM